VLYDPRGPDKTPASPACQHAKCIPVGWGLVSAEATFSHRIIFRVEREAERVVVYRVYHGSRQQLADGDLPYTRRQRG